MNIELEQIILMELLHTPASRRMIIDNLRPHHFNADNKALYQFLQPIFTQDPDMEDMNPFMREMIDAGLINIYIDIGRIPSDTPVTLSSIWALQKEYLHDQYSNAIAIGNVKRALNLLTQINDFSTQGDDSLYPDDFVASEIRDGIANGLNLEMVKTGILDKAYRIIKKQTTVITGSPTSGKSNFMDAMAVNLAARHGWKFLVFSPESQPLKLHLMNLARKYEGQHMMGTKMDPTSSVKFILEHFTFINTNTLDHNIDLILELARGLEFDALVIDPWNELDITEENEGRFISKSLSKIKSFSYRKNCHVFIIAHPTKLKLAVSGPYVGQYPPASAYDIDGSGKWYSKPDNILSVWRDANSSAVEVHVQKIKYEGVTGNKEMVKLTYKVETGSYI